MRLIPNDASVYYQHIALTPGNVRHADHGADDDRLMLLPDLGDIITGFPGYMGEPTIVKVIEVKPIGDGCHAYEVTVATLKAS